MATYYVSSDNINGKEQSYINTIASVLSNAGHAVKTAGVGPITHYKNQNAVINAIRKAKGCL